MFLRIIVLGDGMESTVKIIFPGASAVDIKRIASALDQLGIHSAYDLKYLEKSDVSGQLKTIEVRKIMDLGKRETI